MAPFTTEIVSMLTNKQIARLIVDAYNMGKKDGIEEGYNRGYDDAMQEDEDETCHCSECTGIDDEEDEKEMSSKEFYDAGWKDGYCGKDLDLTMKEDNVYLWGYQDGREEYCREDGEEES